MQRRKHMIYVAKLNSLQTLLLIKWVALSERNYIRACAKRADSDHPAHAQSIDRAFGLHSYILYYSIILIADRKALIRLRGCVR